MNTIERATTRRDATRRFGGPVHGRTYCLYGTSAATRGYYEAVAHLTDECLRRWPDARRLLDDLRQASKSKRRLARLARSPVHDSPAAHALALATEALDPYLCDVEGHLRSLSLGARSDAELTTTREQYVLYCLEVELTNRLGVHAFKTAGTRLAFLPHCLRERDEACLTKVDGLDYVCTGCAPACYIDAVSRLLRAHGIEPYIWMRADLSRVLREGPRRPGGLGVLGIACLPELVAGMRRCERAHVPVVGLPLDGNCCARWWGTQSKNTVDLAQLEALLEG